MKVGFRAQLTAGVNLNPSPNHCEGGAQGLAIVIEFETIDAARALYESDARTDTRAERKTIPDTDLILVEGLLPLQ